MAITKPCVGDTDVRYDPNSSNNAMDQAVVWSKMSGYFRGTGQMRVNALDPFNSPVPSKGDSETIVTSVPVVVFLNDSVVGSRQMTTAVTIYPTIPPPRTVQITYDFATTTHEKDGSLVGVQTTGATNSSSASATVRHVRVVDESAISVTVALSSTGETIRSTSYCLDPECNQYERSFNVYKSINGSVQRVYAAETSFVRMNDPTAWFSAIDKTYDKYHFEEDERLLPPADPCYTELCPSKEMWCVTDPNCSLSPYQEPPVSIRSDVIAALVTISIVSMGLVACVAFLVGARKTKSAFAEASGEEIQRMLAA